MSYFADLLDATGLAPHGMCLLWRPELIWLHVVSDSVIAIAYYSIPLALAYFVRRRSDLAFGWIFWLFAIFILACGTTHVMGIWTLWEPVYAAEGIVKAITAVASIATAILLWPLVPKALALPSPAELARINAELSLQVRERAAAVTALEQEMRERKRTEEALLQAQKIESLGHLTGGVAHDFNNLLQVIAANLELLQVDFADDPRAQNRVEVALAASDRGARLTRQLLAFARRQPLEPVVIDLGQRVIAMSDMLTRTLGTGIQVVAPRNGAVWPTLADPHQVENALLNLAINARDAMPNGGRLILEVANASLDDSYSARNPDVMPGDYVMLAVTDTGTGMTEEIRSRAFEPFFTTKADGQGTGLGLSQVYGFAKQSGGHAALYSEPGQGTTVRLYLPRSYGTPEVEAGASEIATLGRGETVLVVEDDPEVRRASLATLAELGYRVLEADGPARAIELLSGPAPIDLMFSDVIMPGPIAARDLADQAVLLRPGIAVLFTSGYTQNAILHHGHLDDGIALLSKPYRKLDLARKIGAVLAARAAEPSRNRFGRVYEASPDLEGATAGLRILVVEDDVMVGEATTEMLAELGYSGIAVIDAEAALHILERESFDLVMTDIGLPGMDGRALAARVRADWPTTPVLIVSGTGAPGPAGDPMVRHLPKPFTLTALGRALAPLLG